MRGHPEDAAGILDHGADSRGPVRRSEAAELVAVVAVEAVGCGEPEKAVPILEVAPLPLSGRLGEMHMRVVEAGSDQSAPGVNQPGIGSDPAGCSCIGADLHQLAILHRECCRFRSPRIGCEDVCPAHHEVGNIGLPAGGER